VIECDCWCDTEEDDDDESVGVDRSCSKWVCMYVDYIVICYYFVEIVMMSKMIMMIEIEIVIVMMMLTLK